MTPPILTGKNLAFSYRKLDKGRSTKRGAAQDRRLHSELAQNGSNRTMAFEGLNINLESSAILAVLGNNGAGKSSLLNVLAAQSNLANGDLSLLGRNMGAMSRIEVAKHVAYVTQDNRPSHLSVFDQVLMGRCPHLGWSVSMHDRKAAMQAIEQLGLHPLVERYLDELSGGERQKVYIARALAQEPKVLLLDEPTGALDPKNQMAVMQLIRKVTDKNELASVVVMHDINLALRFADHFLLMHNGATVAYGGAEVVTKATLSATYDFPLELIDLEGLRLALPSLA